MSTIKKLRDDVIRSIAAGEVIQHPCNAVKELIENSIDAGSSSIHVTVKRGGISEIQVQDNGSGIWKDDLSVICERFTTSKLECFEDLSKMTTYGFRGEALASLSVASHLTIISKQQKLKCGYKQSYINGKPQSKEPQAIAANQGTMIIVKDLFYNIPVRMKALKERDEYNLIYEVIRKYAIHNSKKTSFKLKKHEGNCDVSTSIESDFSCNINQLYGSEIGKNIINISLKSEKFHYSLFGFISNTDLQLKKSSFILFINNRLVDCVQLKKTTELSYFSYLNKNNYPFAYLDLKVPPHTVDINIHPTKKSVNLLYEEEICNEIGVFITEKLNSLAESKTISTQKLNCSSESPSFRSQKMNSTPRPCNAVRIDPKIRKIDEVLSQNAASQSIGKNSYIREIKYVSILDLRNELTRKFDKSAKEILTDSCFIGCINEKFSLIQHKTYLMVLNLNLICKELFYQIYLRDFGNFGTIELSEPLSIAELVKIYACTCHSKDLDPDLATKTQELLINKKVMLDDYFAIKIDGDGQLCSLPLMLNGHEPNMNMIPKFIYELGTQIDWTTEKECFKTFGQVLGNFYGSPWGPFDDDEDNYNKWVEQIKFIIYPYIKTKFVPTNETKINNFLIAANTSNLYKVFERC